MAFSFWQAQPGFDDPISLKSLSLTPHSIPKTTKHNMTVSFFHPLTTERMSRPHNTTS